MIQNFADNLGLRPYNGRSMLTKIIYFLPVLVLSPTKAKFGLSQEQLQYLICNKDLKINGQFDFKFIRNYFEECFF